MSKYRFLFSPHNSLPRIPAAHHALMAVIGLGSVFHLTLQAQTTVLPETGSVEVLHSFQPPTAIAELRLPYAPLLWIPDRQSFYGITEQGPGISPRGGIFQWSGSSTDPVILHEFVTPEVRQSRQALILDSEGYLQGTASAGGLSSGAFGGVFRIRPDGTGFQQTHIFTGGDQGAAPSSPLAEGIDGFLYGVTDRGGTSGAGTVYRLQKEGTQFQILRHFLANGSDPAKPAHALIPGPSNHWIGVSFAGGSDNMGTVYSISTDGKALEVFHHFKGAPSDGKSPSGSLLSHEGWLWGVTLSGGASNFGSIFRLHPDGTSYELIHSFAGRLEGESPYGHLCLSRDGFLYGTTSAGGGQSAGSIYRIHPQTLVFETVFRSQRIREHPQLPQAGLVQASDGSLYGTSTGGGDFGFGTLYRLRPPATFQIIPSGQEWILQWIDNGLDYHAESSASLGNDSPWERFPANSELNGNRRTLRIPAPTGSLFIRLNSAVDP